MYVAENVYEGARGLKEIKLKSKGARTGCIKKPRREKATSLRCESSSTRARVRRAQASRQGVRGLTRYRLSGGNRVSVALMETRGGRYRGCGFVMEAILRRRRRWWGCLVD